MATTTADEMAALLADAYEILKRHEQVLFGMAVDIQTLKANLPGHERERLEDRKKEILLGEDHLADAEKFDNQVRLLDATISRLRGT